MKSTVTDELGRSEIRFSRLKLGGVFLLLMMFVLVCAVFVVFPPEPDLNNNARYNLPTWAVQGVSFVFALLLFMGARSVFKQMNNPEPALILDADGITDNTSDFARGLIWWADIDDVSKLEVEGGKLISLHVFETIDHKEPNVKMLTMARKATHLMGKDTINIDTQNLEGDFETLFNRVKAYHQKYKLISNNTA